MTDFFLIITTYIGIYYLVSDLMNDQYSGEHIRGFPPYRVSFDGKIIRHLQDKHQ